MSKRPPHLRALAAVALTSLLLQALPAAAQWMWRGADGRVNASDRPPPPGVADKDIIKRPAADQRRRLAAGPAPAASGAAGEASAPGLAASGAARAASAPPTALEREAQARKQAAEQDKLAKAKADEDRASAQRASNCRQARSQAASLESGIRVVRTNEKGEREVLDDRSRAEELRRAQAAIASECK
jgi:hypothetical protein